VTHDTSLAVWEQIQASLPRRRREVLALVLRYPNRTCRELEALSGLRDIDKRLADLADRGLIVRIEGVCSVSGHKALRCRAEITAVAKPAPPRPSWKARALKAEADLASLRRTLAMAPQEELELLRTA